MFQKFCFKGKEEGVNLLVFGAVHGNEVAGVIALKRLVKEIEEKKIVINKGSLTVVPVCNIEANRLDVRQIDENLNRVMKFWENPKTYEQKIANELCCLIKDCDILLDLHSTHCKGDEPFVFCDYPKEMNLKLIDVIDVKYVLEGWPDIYAGQDVIEDYSTEKACFGFGKSGTTLECGYHKEEKAWEVAYNAVLNALGVFEIIEKENPKKVSKTHILMKNFVVKNREGCLLKNYKHLDRVKKGEEIARYDDGEVLVAQDDGYILLPNLEAEIGAEWYYFGVEKL
ncbi:MAG: succinylglutamate desuccinylase/aspartoacylase family protein [Alphaproteobacteria bacterium]|nr:succinylglutamate desuccinylase/aspartoacylase family protein [Alphaproteobacteria bacterium]